MCGVVGHNACRFFLRRKRGRVQAENAKEKSQNRQPRVCVWKRTKGGVGTSGRQSLGMAVSGVGLAAGKGKQSSVVGGQLKGGLQAGGSGSPGNVQVGMCV